VRFALPAIFLLTSVPGAFPLCSAVLASAEDTSDKAHITGAVVDTDGQAVTNAEVRVIDANVEPVRTDEAGRFSVVLKHCNIEACLVASDSTGARIGMWQTPRNGITLVPQSADVRIVVRPSIPVRVEVVDAKLAPVPGARVVAVHSEWFPVATAETDGAGMATLRLPDTADLTHIFAQKAGVGFDYMENFVTSPSPLADPPPVETRLILHEARPLRLKAISPDNTPVQNVEFAPSYVMMPGKKQSLSLHYTARAGGLMRSTDATGTATFDFLPGTLTRVRFTCGSEQYRQYEDLYCSATAAGMPSNLTNVVVRTQSLSGSVLLPDGSAAAGIMVKVEGSAPRSSSHTRVRTRKDGTFTVRVGSEKSYILGVVDDTWAARSLTGVVVKEGHDRTDLVIQLRPGTLVTGTVRDAATGKCPTHSLVTVTELGATVDPTALLGSSSPTNVQESLTRWVETDTRGRYSIRIGPGEYKMYASGDRSELSVAEEPELQRDFTIQVRD
jgi:hypothetical protein